MSTKEPVGSTESWYTGDDVAGASFAGIRIRVERLAT